LKRWEAHGTTSNFTMSVLYFWSSSLYRLGDLIYPLRGLLEVIEFRVWLKKRLGPIKIYRHKGLLLDEILRRNNSAESVVYFEFGVAFGEMAKYLIPRTTTALVYHGFDTFEGLPKAWRSLPIGAISNNGNIPEILGWNIYFHKGLIQETISQVDFNSQSMKFFIFDFDLYEPTLFALKHVIPNMKIGDIVYFDEAFDSEERVIVENYFLDEFEFEVIGASAFGLAFKILSSKV
jgi:hypothetical protein